MWSCCPVGRKESGAVRLRSKPSKPSLVRALLVAAFVASSSVWWSGASQLGAQEPGDVFREELEDGGWVEHGLVRSEGGPWVVGGMYRRFDADGNLRVSGTFEDGLPSKAWTWRGPDRLPLARGHFKGGKRNGVWVFYWPTGEKRVEGRYDGNRRVGPWKYFTPDGEPISERSGRRVPVDATSTASGIHATGTLVDGLFEGAWRFDWPNGTTMLTGQFEAGVRRGRWHFYLPDGTEDESFVRTHYKGDPFESWIDFAPTPTDVLPLSQGEIEWRAEHRAKLGGAFSDLVEHFSAAAEGKEGLRLLDLFLQGNERDQKAASALLTLEGADAFLPTLAVLLHFNLATPTSTARAGRLLSEVVEPLVHREFPWRYQVDEASQIENRQTLLRLVALYQLSVDKPWVLDLDLAGRPDAPLPLSLEEWTDGVGREVRMEKPESPAAALLFPEPGSWDQGPKWIRTSVAGGLAWLARHQEQDGHWSAAAFPERCSREGTDYQWVCTGAGSAGVDTGVTALSLLAFLRAGNTPREGEYAEVVRKGVGYLLSQADPETGAVGPGRTQWRFMEEALALSVFCEVLGTVESPALEEAAVAAIRHLRTAQAPYSGWRYDLPSQGKSDTAVTGLVLQALLSARIVGLDVSDEIIEGGLTWLDEATDISTGRVGYDERGSYSSRYSFNEGLVPRKFSEGMTAIANFDRQLFLGERGKEYPLECADLIEKGLRLLDSALPWHDEASGNRVDGFYWTFGAYVTATSAKPHRKRWATSIRATVPQLQSTGGDETGSWDPSGVWGMIGGRVYSTAMMCLTLEALRGG